MDNIYEKYQREGCLKIENFLTPEEVDDLRKGLTDVVESMTDDSSYVFSVYRSGAQKEADDYFINSADKIKYFFENDAFDAAGKLTVPKKEALCKIGYALHWWHPTFKKHNFSEKVKNLMKTLQYKDPVITQSMLIFKKPKIGEIVRPHQDSTFLYTEPPTCIGLWFPLEDATLENGCLWYVPGSHKGDPVYQRFVRNEGDGPKLVMQGTLPNYSDEEYVPVPAKKALHWLHTTFKKHIFSDKIKKPKIGEIVRPHQYSTFLYSEPPTSIGLWFPLEDATLENGCLWYVPGSHIGDPVYQRFVRNNEGEGPKLVMQGTLPNYSDEEYVPVPAKKGDCVIIHGSVVHKSGRNTTNVARTVYTTHMVEKDAVWSPLNWSQPTEKLPYQSLYAN